MIYIYTLLLSFSGMLFVLFMLSDANKDIAFTVVMLSIWTISGLAILQTMELMAK